MNFSFEGLLSLAIGVAVGLVLAIPVGPTAILCMRRTLQRGTIFGFATGLGASLADAFYGAGAAFGISAISGFLKQHDITVRLAGGVFMLVMAIRLFRAHALPKAKTAEEAPASNPGHAIGALISGFFLTVTNPMTMFGFVTVFTSLHWIDVVKADFAGLLVLGVGLGSALWWLILTLFVRRLRHRLDVATLRRVNLFAGVLLALFGIFTLVIVALKLLKS